MSSKSRRVVRHTQQEEKQAKQVFKIVIVAIVILALAMLIGFSFLG